MCAIKPPAVLALLAASLWTAPALAQVQRGGGGTASAALMQQYQQVVSERDRLQADNAKLKKDNDELRRQMDTVKEQLATTKAGATRNASALATAQASSESNARALTDSRGKMQELIGRFRETAAQLRTVESDRAVLQQQLTQSKAAFDKCAQSNFDLYQVTNEVLDRYAHQSAFSYMAKAEPFTRIKRTEIDNLVLEYRERAEQLRVKPVASGAATGSASGPASTPAPNPQAAPGSAETNTSAPPAPAAVKPN
jgi:chromosome segregation ATPase